MSIINVNDSSGLPDPIPLPKSPTSPPSPFDSSSFEQEQYEKRVANEMALLLSSALDAQAKELGKAIRPAIAHSRPNGLKIASGLNVMIGVGCVFILFALLFKCVSTKSDEKTENETAEVVKTAPTSIVNPNEKAAREVSAAVLGFNASPSALPREFSPPPPFPSSGLPIIPPTSPATVTPSSPTAYTLKPNEWLHVETDGKKVQFDWNTPDRKVFIRFRFLNGEIREEEMEYGHPTKDFGSAPANLEFFHSRGGTVWITKK